MRAPFHLELDVVDRTYRCPELEDYLATQRLELEAIEATLISKTGSFETIHVGYPIPMAIQAPVNGVPAAGALSEVWVSLAPRFDDSAFLLVYDQSGRRPQVYKLVDH